MLTGNWERPKVLLEFLLSVSLNSDGRGALYCIFISPTVFKFKESVQSKTSSIQP